MAAVFMAGLVHAPERPTQCRKGGKHHTSLLADDTFHGRKMAHTESFLIPAPQLKSIGDVLLSHNEKVDSTGDAYGARCLVTMQPPSASRK